MAKPFYFVIQSWMLEDMHLKLGEAAVYAYIHGLTNAEGLENKGWRGSKRCLATVLHTSPSTMNDIINRLEERGFIHIHNGLITSTINREPAPKSPNVRNSDTSEPLPGTDTPF